MLPQFELVVQLAIVMSCISLALENPNGEVAGSARALVFYLGDIFFTSLFTAELLLKVQLDGCTATLSLYPSPLALPTLPPRHSSVACTNP